jgi:transposase-like protein
MAEGQGSARRKRLLTPEEKYEIWVQVLTRQLTQAEAAVRWGVDPTTVMKLRRVAKEGALTALAAARPGRPRQPEEDAELAAAKAEVARLGEAVKELAVENLLLRGKSSWG